MPLTLIRPQLPDDKKKELKDYLWTKWIRARTTRQGQVDGDYSKWTKSYEGVPLEAIRTVPFYKASNLVVPVIRVFLDTFVARTLNVLFATRPLYIVEGFPADVKEGYELYLNRKALYDWGHYEVVRDLMFRGNKNGSVVYKIPYVECKTTDVMPVPNSTTDYTEQEITYFRGPCAKPVPFEDFYIYPITANCLSEARIKFCRVRYVEEDVQQLVDQGDMFLPEGRTVETYTKVATDAKRLTQQGDAHIMDTYTRELHLIEAYLQYPITNNSSKYYEVIVTFEEWTGDIFDVYYNPYPHNLCIFTDYRPFPREDLYFGESLCKMLGQAQEEASRIHNERRDNSTIASSVIFKRKSGSLLPNPSTNWYPGKVFDLDDMDDLDVINIGRNYEDMIAQEDYVFTLGEKLSGIGEVMQAASTGAVGRRGIYNTMGTIGVIAEGNQRQDTNIRDVRVAVGRAGLLSARIQANYAPDDPMLDTLPPEAADGARRAMKFLQTDKARYVRLEVKTSNAGINAEVQKANLMAMAQNLGQYGQFAMQMAPQILNPSTNPVLRILISDIAQMQRNMAKRLLKAFDEWDAIEDLPDLVRLSQQAQQQQASQPGGQGPPNAGAPGPNGAMSPQYGGAGGPPQGVPRGLLEDLSQLQLPSPGRVGTTGLV